MAAVIKPTQEVIKDALASVKVKDVTAWVKSNLGSPSPLTSPSFYFDPLYAMLIWTADQVLEPDTYRVQLDGASRGITDLHGNLLDGETRSSFDYPAVSGDGRPGGDFEISFTVDSRDTQPARVNKVEYQRSPYNRGEFFLQFSDKLDIVSVQAASVELRGRGDDAVFDTNDDTLAPVDVYYNRLRDSDRSQLYVYSRGIVDPDSYRLTASFVDAAGHDVTVNEIFEVERNLDGLGHGPSVIDLSIQPQSVVTEELSSIEVTFSGAIDPTTLTQENIRLRYSPDARFFDANDTLLTDGDGQIEWNPMTRQALFAPARSLDNGYYILEISGDEDGIADVAGQKLDGEILDANIRGATHFDLWPDVPSGDGRPGGDYRAYFIVSQNSTLLTISLSETEISENGGSVRATVTRSDGRTGRSLLIALSSDASGEISHPSRVTIPANQDSVTFDIHARDDNFLDGTKTVSVVASADGYVPGSAAVEVHDHEELTLEFSVGAIHENDGNGASQLTVLRSNTDNAAELTISLDISDATEIEVPDTVTIPAGEDSATLSIDAIDDTLLDGSQTVDITATATGYVAARKSLTVLDHETLTVQIAADVVREDAGVDATMATITRSNTNIDTALIVALDASDTSEIGIPTSVSIAANEASVSFMIDVRDDDLVDGSQTVTVIASADGYFSGMDSFDVLDHEVLRDTWSISIDSSTISEHDGAAATTATITRTDMDAGADLAVTLASSNIDEIEIPAIVTIPANETSVTFEIGAKDDMLLDGTRTVTITASAAGYAPIDAFLEVLDHETLLLELAVTAIREDSGANATSATITRSNSDNMDEITVAVDNSDLSEIRIPEIVTIPAHARSMTFRIDAVDDRLLDGSQLVHITVTADGYTSGTRSLEVTDHETLSVQIASNTVGESDGANAATATVTRGNTDDFTELVVSLRSDDASEINIPGSVTIPANAASASFPIDARDDDIADGAQTVIITASAVGFFSGSDSLAVLDNEMLRDSWNMSVGTSVIWENDGIGTTTATITRNNADIAEDLVVTLTSSDASEIEIPTTVSITPGELSVTFEIGARDDQLLDGDQSVVITAHASGYTPIHAALEVRDHEELALDIAVASIHENAGVRATTGTVTRSNWDNASPLTVVLSNSDTSEIDIPSSVMIPAGERSVDFDIDAIDDKSLDGLQAVSIIASAIGYVSASRSLGVLDYELLSLRISADAISENSGPRVATATVTRSNLDVREELVVSLHNRDPTELSFPASITIPAGQASASFEIDAKDDQLLDGSQTVVIAASATGYATGDISLEVLDYETLIVRIASDTITEDDGPDATTATVTRSNNDNAAELEVTLQNGDPREIDIPASVTISAGETSVSFNIGAVNDGLADGPKSVRIGVSASGYITGSASVQVVEPVRNRWTNPDNRYDVNRDLSVSPVDALLIINELNSIGAHLLPEPTPSVAPPPFYDVSADAFIAPLDALMVINFLNDLATSQAAHLTPLLDQPILSNIDAHVLSAKSPNALRSFFTWYERPISPSNPNRRFLEGADREPVRTKANLISSPYHQGYASSSLPAVDELFEEPGFVAMLDVISENAVIALA